MKIALCFLTYGSLSQPTVWKPFIDSKHYNMYIHNKNIFHGEYKKFCISRRISTRWGRISLVKATLLLFMEAYKNKENMFFILLSDKCIPLYSPDILYQKITSIDNNIIFSSINTKQIRYNSLYNTSFFTKNTYKIQHQWMCLTRNTVAFFIKHNFTHIFGPRSDVPDEHYFVNIMEKYNIPYLHKKMTYVNWSENSDLPKYKKKPKTYSVLTNEMVHTIIQEGCFFMRKVGPECRLPSYFSSFM